ncbi:MAG: tetratricopeptide repeat protein [Myxococcota bacterium]
MRTALCLVLPLLALLACSEPGQTEVARGNVLASRGKLTEAIEAYRAAAKAAPRKARPRELLGHVLFDQGRFAEARTAYQEALGLEPAAALEARIGLARVEAEEGKLKEAIEHLGRVISDQPGNVYARLSRANLAMRRGGEKDAELAISDTAEAMKVDADNASVLYTRGCAFLAAHEPGKASEAFRVLENAHPHSPLAPYGQARVAAAAQKRADVVLHLRETKARARSVTGAWSPDDILKDPAFLFMKDDPDFLRELQDP